MSKPRDWQDRYFDGDDLGALDEHLFPIDEDDETCDDEWDEDDDIIGLFSLDLTDDLEEDDDEYGI